MTPSAEAKQMLVIGCGRLGAELAYGLFQRGHHVSVVDRASAAFANLPGDFRGKTIEGDVLDKGLLERAGMRGAAGVAAVTSSDAVNALVGHLARTAYGVPHVVVRNYNPRWLPLVQDFGFPVISSSIWGAQRMQDLLDGETHAVFAAGNGEVQVYEVPIGPAWAGRAVADLPGAGEWRPVSLTRGGRATLVDAPTVVADGDVLHVAATPDGARALRVGATPEREA